MPLSGNTFNTFEPNRQKAFDVARILSLAAALTLCLSAFLTGVSWSENFGLSHITVNDRPALSLGVVNLTDRDLIDGKIVVSGHSDSEEVKYSLDAGKTWSTAPVKEGRFQIEYEPGDNSRDFTFLFKSGSGVQNFAVVVRYQNRKYWDQFEEIFRDIRDIYIDARLYEFLKFFEEDAYDNFEEFEENMEDTFDRNSNFNIRITIATIDVKDDVALLRVDWERRWDDVSFNRGANNIIRFHKKDGVWRITDIEDEAIFAVGTGRFRGNISDR